MRGGGGGGKQHAHARRSGGAESECKGRLRLRSRPTAIEEQRGRRCNGTRSAAFEEHLQGCSSSVWYRYLELFFTFEKKRSSSSKRAGEVARVGSRKLPRFAFVVNTREQAQRLRAAVQRPSNSYQTLWVPAGARR